MKLFDLIPRIEPLNFIFSIYNKIMKETENVEINTAKRNLSIIDINIKYYRKYKLILDIKYIKYYKKYKLILDIKYIDIYIFFFLSMIDINAESFMKCRAMSHSHMRSCIGTYFC